LSDSDHSDSSDDYDLPPVDDSVYDLQFDPYFYQGSISLEDIPDDQPIDYPCPYDVNGEYVSASSRQYNPHFSYIDNWNYNPVTTPGDLYRSQSHPEDISHRHYEDEPLDANAPLHVFLSQPLPSQVSTGFSLETTLLRPRKRGEFSSLCSFGGSQLYTITEEVESDDYYDDFHTRRNYSESDLYCGDPEGFYSDSHYISSDLYYGDTDSESESTIHSELSDFRLSTETLEQDSEEFEEADQWSRDATDDNQVVSEININPFFESCSDKTKYINNHSQKHTITYENPECISETSLIENSTSPFEEVEDLPVLDSESSCQGEYPDEFFLFCSEAEITDMEVMEKVDMLPYSNNKDDFTYFKVEGKVSGRSSPADQDFLLESYTCSVEKNNSYTNADNSRKTTTAVPYNSFWEGNVNGTAHGRKESYTPVYQNVLVNTRLSKSNPNLASIADEVEHSRQVSRPVYQNVPVPAKRYHLPATEDDINNANVYDRNSNYPDYRSEEIHVNKCYSPYMNVPYSGPRGEASAQYRSESQMTSSSSLVGSLDLLSSNGYGDTHFEEHHHSRDLESMRYRSQRASQDLRFVGVAQCPQVEASFGLHNPSFLDRESSTRSAAAFSAYASNTSLDHDTFSKTSKIYKWNGSSSVSDLTSLNRDLSPSPPGLTRGSASATDLSRVTPDEEGGIPRRASLGETSYAAWCAHVHEDQDGQEEFVLSHGHRNTSPFVFTPHPKSGKRAMMEFYVNTLTSDSDTGSDSSTTASTTDSDTDNDDDEDGTGGRSYQVTAPGDGLLATIEEDAEEDSGNESSGHWLFSADNTDTDSVIHLPAVIDTCPPVHPLHHTLHEGESSGSEETLVVEDEQENAGQGVGSSQQQEVGVVKKSHALTTTAPTTTTALTTTTAPTTAATDTHYDPSAVCERDQGGAAGTGSVVSTSDRRRRLHEGRAGVPPTGRRPLPTMLGRAHVAATLYEQQLDDVFDFESLESCESVSGGSEASFSAHDNTSLNDTHLVFTTSATSQPFDDAASGYIEDDNSDSRHLTVQEEAWSTPSRPPHSHDETTSAPPHLNTTFVVDGSQHTILERSLEGVLPGLASTLSGLNGDEKRTEGRPSAVVNIQHVQSSTGHGKMCESNKSEGVCDDLQLCQTKSGPERVDLFGLPVRWTPTGAAHHPLPGAPQDAAYRTVLTHEEHMSAPLSSDRRPSDTGISPGLASSSDVTAGESGGETGVEVAREVSPTFTTHTGSGETSSEACHYQPPPPGNLLHHLSVPPQVLRDAGVVAPAGTGPQHDPVGTMRDATPSSIDLITERTQPPRASHPTQQPVDPPTTHHAHPPDANSDLPSGDSDTDTDNTDGDYDEEDHFSAEVSLRISVPSEAATAVKSFRSSDISQVSGGEGGGAGRGAAPEPRAASQSSSPAGVPDTVRWSECPSATDSLSEVSSLDASLTPISESATRPSLTEPATARPRRQHVLQTRMGRTRSCGDLRRYSESESEEEAADMSGLPQSVARLPQDAGTRPFKSTFATYIEQQHRQGEWHGATRSGGRRPRPPPAHPLSGSDASDEEVRSHYAGHRGHCRPRRHRSFHEAPPACRHEPQALRQVRGGTWAVPPPPPPAPLPGRRRPQPISVDLAEEFLSQESFKLPNGKQSAGKALGERICSVERGAPEQHPGAGTGPSQGPRPPPPSQQPGDGGTAIGVCGGGALPDPAGSRSEVRPPPPVLTPELTVQRAPPPLAPPPSQPPDHHPHQYSSTLAQLSNECHPVHTGHSSSGPTHDPPAATHDPPAAAHALTPAGSDPSRQCLPADTSVSPEMAEGRVRVRTKTYGTHGEVEVYLARADSGITPPHPSPVLTPTGGADHRPGSRGVTFSPSVKEVNWRESYYDVDPDEDTADAVDVRKVVVVTAESPRPQRVTVGTPPPALVPVNSTAVPENTAGNRASSPGHTVSALPEHISPAPNHATEPKHTSAEPKHIITVPGHIPTVSSNNVYNRPDKANGIASEQPVLSSSSDAELNGEKSPKVSTPIWQRFKLPKIPSPKAQRPKLPPKPQSLSSRSSDTESSKPSSPAPDSGSSTPSSPDNRQKKAPSSPRFFTWGNKRDKTRNLPRPLVSPPPPPAQGSTRQVRQELEVEVKGEPESSVSVGALSHEDGVGSCKSASGDCLVKRVVPRESVSAVKGLDRGGNYTHSATIGLNEGVDLTCSAARGVNKSVDSADSATRGLNQGVDSTYSATRGVNKSVDSADSATRGVDAELCSADSDASLESNRSPAPSVTSGDDSSDIGQLHSPRSAVSKPPLPPQLQQRPSQQVFHKARLLSARRQYFSQERQVSAPERSSPPKDLNDSPAPVAQPPPPPLSASRYNSAFDASKSLKERFEKFSASARAERERLAKSTPDLSVIEASVRRPGPRIDSCNQREQQQQQQPDSGSAAWASDGDTAEPAHAHHGVSNAHNKARAAIHERYKTRAQRIYARSRTQSVGVLETDLDTGASREVLTLQETNLDDLYRDLQQLLDTLPALGAPQGHSDKARAKSLLDLEGTSATMDDQLTAPPRPPDTRAKSMEFLLDDNNKASVECQLLLEAGCEPPENELMKGSERQLSEAELRVRRSLQRLDVPEWMKNAQPQQQGFLLRRRDYGSSTASATGGGWSAYSSKTASMTSLGSSRAHTPNTPTKVVIPTRVTSRGMTGLGGVTSPASNCSISPSPSDRSGSLFQYPISRWSTSRLNSGTTTPTGSVTSTKSTATYTRQPYLGWRSQTSLASLAGSQSSLTNTGSYLTAADRLALGITAYSQRFVKSAANTQDKENSSAEANVAAPLKPDSEDQNDKGSTNGSIKLQVPDVADVHSSIKEVTSAIVHYCNESTPSPRASPRGSPRPEGRAPSPRRLVWVESSFVGSRPITSPETPTGSSHAITPTSQLNGHDLAESGEATSRPPQPPGEYLLAW
ncbi:hypothetical protein OTU49_009813, partial [Cherax quadricarinatus]